MVNGSGHCQGQPGGVPTDSVGRLQAPPEAIFFSAFYLQLHFFKHFLVGHVITVQGSRALNQKGFGVSWSVAVMHKGASSTALCGCYCVWVASV